MKKPVNYVLFITLLVITYLLISTSIEIKQLSNLFETQKIEQSKENSIDNKLTQTKEIYKKKVENITNDILKDTKNYINSKLTEYFPKKDYKIEYKEQKKEKKVKVTDYKEKLEDKSKDFLIYLGVMIIVIFLSLLLKKINQKISLIFLSSAIMITLYLGIFIPVITVEIFKELPVFGHTILKYEIKSIYNTISGLIEQNNILVATLLIVFSIFIPMLKTTVVVISIFTNKSIEIIERLGKWSMADVFVVSIFISILSMNSDKMTNANYEVGLLFYTIYVLLSMALSEITIRNNKKVQFLKIKKEESKSQTNLADSKVEPENKESSIKRIF